MLTALHHLQYGTELVEVRSLRGSQWMFFEEREDDAHQLTASLHGEAPQRRTVVVTTPVRDQPSDTEVLLKEPQRRQRWRTLRDRELVLNLPTEPAHSVAHHTDRETAFTVDKADDPLLESWSFLLIVRTTRVVTGHILRILPSDTNSRRTYDRVPVDTRVFQHIANCTRHLTVTVGRLCCTQSGSTLGRL